MYLKGYLTDAGHACSGCLWGATIPADKGFMRHAHERVKVHSPGWHCAGGGQVQAVAVCVPKAGHSRVEQGRGEDAHGRAVHDCSRKEAGSGQEGRREGRWGRALRWVWAAAQLSAGLMLQRLTSILPERGALLHLWSATCHDLSVHPIGLQKLLQACQALL